MQSHYAHVFQEHLFQMQAKLLMMHVASVSQNLNLNKLIFALGKQVCAEYRGRSKMHLHRLPLVFSKVLPIY